jgi:hypothetical protein
MIWRLVILLMLWAGSASAHQSGNSYLTIASDAQALSVQADFPVKDLPDLLQLADRQQVLDRQQVEALGPELAKLIAESLEIEADGTTSVLKFEGQRLVLRNDGLYISQRHVAAPLSADAGSLVLRYPFFSEEKPVARAFVKLTANGMETSAVFDARHATQRMPLREMSTLELFGSYAREGTLHIWSGPDHLLFLLCLLLPGLSLAASGMRPLLVHALQVVTAFTASHSLTLAAAALDWIVLPDKLVEVAIAASIVIAALLVLRSRRPDHQWKLALGFGLVHGLGFANGLRELGLSTDNFIGTLLAFNLGVEFGQIAVVIVVGLLLYPLLRSAPAIDRIQRGGAWVNLVLATGWLVERTVG